MGTAFRIGKQRLTKQNNVFTVSVVYMISACLLYKQSVDVPLGTTVNIGQMLYHYHFHTKKMCVK